MLQWVEKIRPSLSKTMHRRTGPVSFRGLRSVARIFSPLLARKSSGFARILPDFLPEYGYYKNSRGAAAPQPPPRLVRL